MKKLQKSLQSLSIMCLALLILGASLNSCTPYSFAQTRFYPYPGTERYNIERMTRNALIVTGGAYALYNIMQHRNMAQQPLSPMHYPQPAPQVWKCFATVTWPETKYSAQESYIGPVYQHTSYAIAHTQAYKHCKSLGANFQNGCRVTCYQ